MLLLASDALGIPGNQRAVGAWGGFGFSKDVNPVVDLQSAEEVTDAFADATFGKFTCPIGQRPHLTKTSHGRA